MNSATTTPTVESKSRLRLGAVAAMLQLVFNEGYSAAADPERGLALLNRFRASLELIRLGLLADDLPHAGVLVAVCDLLPGASPQTRAEVQARFGQVQPIELVGLDPSLPSGLALVDARSLR